MHAAQCIKQAVHVVHHEHNTHNIDTPLLFARWSFLYRSYITDIHYSLGCRVPFGTEARSERIYIYLPKEREHLIFKNKTVPPKYLVESALGNCQKSALSGWVLLFVSVLYVDVDV